MARTREVIVDQDEDIVAFEHNLAGKFVRVLVGFGTALPDGTFIPAESQNYENFIIQGSDYDALMAASETKPAGVFRREDLWPMVDIGRANFLADRERERIQSEARIAASLEQINAATGKAPAGK